MKAKVKTNNKIIDVTIHGEDANGNPILYTDGKCNFYKPEDLDFNVEQSPKDKLVSLNEVCEWLEEHLIDYWSQKVTEPTEFINELKKAMEE
jgi:hypothetical protein